jgi:hypothetical protein
MNKKERESKANKQTDKNFLFLFLSASRIDVLSQGGEYREAYKCNRQMLHPVVVVKNRGLVRGNSQMRRVALQSCCWGNPSGVGPLQ